MFSQKQNVFYYQGKPSLLFRILIFALSIVFSNSFYSLHQPNIPEMNQIPLYDNIFWSIMVGVLIYLILYYITKFLMNNNELNWIKFNLNVKFNSKTTYVFFITLIFILSALFTAQTSFDLSQQSHTIYADQYSNNNYALSPDNTKLAYTIGKGSVNQYLVIKNLQDNSKTKLYSVCMTNSTCIKLSNVEELLYYNSTTLLIYSSSTTSNKITRYTFDLNTDKITSIKDNYPNLIEFSNTIISNKPFNLINSSVYYATFNNTFYYANSNGISYLKLINDFTNDSYTIQIPNGSQPGPVNFAISPDFTKLAFSEGSNFTLYSLRKVQSGFNASILSLTYIPSSFGNAQTRFSSWFNNHSTIYYSSYSSENDYSYFYSFNFNTSQLNYIGSLRGDHLAYYVNPTDSYFITGPSSMDIYSYKANNLTLLKKDPSINYLVSINSGNQFLTITFYNTEPNGFSNSKLFLMSYDFNSNIVSTQSIIDVSTYQIIPILTQLSPLLTFTTIFIIITFLFVFTISNDSYVSKKPT